MHRHDFDLIAEYAGGTLQDDSRAKALVESCETCAAEFHAQRAIIEQLNAVGSAAMTEHERAALHRDLWTELRSGRQPASTAAVSGWRSWALGAAAALVLVVGLFGVLNGGIIGGDSVAETFNEIASDLGEGASETTAQASSDEGGDGAEEDFAPFADSDEQSPLFERYSETPFAQIAREIRSEDDAVQGLSSPKSGSVGECLAELGLIEHEVVEGYESLTDLLIVIPTAEDIATAPISFVEPESCTVVHVED